MGKYEATVYMKPFCSWTSGVISVLEKHQIPFNTTRKHFYLFFGTHFRERLSTALNCSMRDSDRTACLVYVDRGP